MSTHTDTTPETKRESYKQLKNSGDDVSLRKKVAATIAMSPATTSELSSKFDHSSNALRPRVNELIRMGCVQRSGKRTNPSGHEAYVHHITQKGKRYLRGNIEPEPAPTLSKPQTDVVDVAREVCAGGESIHALKQVVKSHDASKLRRNPDWSPEHLLTSNPSADGLTKEQIKQIKDDPVLDISDFEGGL